MRRPLGRTLVLALTALYAIAATVDCTDVIDGSPAPAQALGLSSCAGDLDCGPGRHCNMGVCAADCVTSKDCSYALSSPDAPNDLECSFCGRCVPKGTRDSQCLGVVDQPCSSDAECKAATGDGYHCNPHGFCAHVCTIDDDCKEMGAGFGCGDVGLCVRKCFRNPDCVYFGYRYACSLPAGVDPVANADAFQPVYGECLKTANLGLSPVTPSSPPAAKYQGVWGTLLASSVRVTAVPILTTMNTVSIQRLLMKATLQDGVLRWDQKWCSVTLKNFTDQDTPPLNLFQVVIPDRNVGSITMTAAHAATVPELLPGASFDTDKIIDLRGARLEHPETDALPSYKDLTHQWDQDRDGQPGMTAEVTGTLQGEIYQAQRTVILFHANVFDADHLGGLVDTTSDATVLGATQDTLINDAKTTQHPDASRSYFRAQRLGDDASCADVIHLADTDGSWLAFHPHNDATAKP